MIGEKPVSQTKIPARCQPAAGSCLSLSQRRDVTTPSEVVPQVAGWSLCEQPPADAAPPQDCVVR